MTDRTTHNGCNRGAGGPPAALSRAARGLAFSGPGGGRMLQALRRIPALLMLIGGLLGAGSAVAMDKSGVSSQAINLPNGPGSIEGLGQSFEPQLNTGSSGYSIPIMVNPSTAGFVPDLAFEYSSDGASGLLGYGWTISAPMVARRNAVGIPRYVDGDNFLDDDGDGEVDEPDTGHPDMPTDEIDKFVNETGALLQAFPDNEFYARFEEAFVRYRRLGNEWECTKPDGTRYLLGRSDASRLVDIDTGRTAAWLVDEMVDRHGNTIRFSYREYPGPSNLNQKYLSRIEYGAGAPPLECLSLCGISVRAA